MRTMQVLCNVFVGFSIVFAGATFLLYPPVVKESTQLVVSEPVQVVAQAAPKVVPKPAIVPVVKKQHIPTKDLQCMAMNIYHEARGESKKGKEAVAWVTLNRVNHNSYPSTVCGVVKQAKYSKWFKEVKGKNVPLKNQCHFSWYCDGRDDEPRDKVQWEISLKIAEQVMLTYNTAEDPTFGAIMYHADYVKPYWKNYYQKLVKIDTHIFYGEKQV